MILLKSFKLVKGYTSIGGYLVFKYELTYVKYAFFNLIPIKTTLVSSIFSISDCRYWEKKWQKQIDNKVRFLKKGNTFYEI